MPDLNDASDAASAAATSSRRAADRMQDSPVLKVLARGGFAMNGLLHILIGGIALSVAFGGGGEADQSGALGSLAANPGGVFVLVVVVIGLLALGLFQLLEAVLVRGTDKDAWVDRAKEGGKGIAYLAVGASAATYARGGSSDSSGQTQDLSASLLAAPGGVFALVAVALAIAAIGVYFIVKGARKKFLSDIAEPRGAATTAIVVLGVGGYIAKGIALVVVGGLFGIAAATADPSAATGLDGALKSLVALPFGVAILTLVALGLIFYGVYCFARAKYARL
ncbi:uncharacterized protein DUF1206 [Glaciihabitans tibetensis]|uniref:Uncharacterized protein DUF1206 n=1 Tax=Glaciihabitans tibetensis TaxID=1266600 RepID=A0A2T0VBY9_9MICO|nr:DUF1206 domain-containing protein [Glaciihabitans tibetensis]PRY67683.1 uncharacterized protein DUF1206 [Glaciihabitans tibetensis]